MHIIFKIFPASSHLNATYKFASELKSKGYKITYAGLKEYEKDVVAQGFHYFLDQDVFPSFTPSIRKVNFLDKLKHRNQFKKTHADYLKGDGFDNIIASLNPDLIIVDSPYVRHAIPLFNKGMPFLIFESMVALNKGAFNPPPCSRIIPKYNLYHKILIAVAWKKYFLKSGFERIFFNALFPSNTLIKKLTQTSKFPVNEIDFDRYFHIGLNNVPELIASPLEFDFPHKKANNQYYVGASVNMDRKESSYDFKYLQAGKNIDTIKRLNENCHPAERITLIYCSFGSMAWRYEGVKEFYTKLINIYRDKKKVHLFISIGYELNYYQFRNLPDNIHVFQKVPQLDLLKNVDLMITHGGMNTITECILSEVPMLVYPGTNQIDQVGNACRVNFHQIGLMGSLKKDRKKTIEKKLAQLLNNKIFKKNIHKMKEAILNNKDETSEALMVIDSILNKSSDDMKFNKMELAAL